MPSRERRLKENAKKVAKENKSLTSYFSTSNQNDVNEPQINTLKRTLIDSYPPDTPDILPFYSQVTRIKFPLFSFAPCPSGLNPSLTVAEVHQPPCSATKPAPTQPYIAIDPVPSQLYTEETSSEAETIRPGPITMANKSVHSVSDPVPSPTQPYTTEEPGPLTMANEFVHGESNETLNLNDDEIQQFIESNDNKNTSKKTLNDKKKVENFLKQRNENSEIHIIPVNELDSLMANFIIAAKKKDGFDYEPTSLRGIISSIDRKLRRHRYVHYIGGDEKHTKFPLTKETLKTKMKLLKKQGKGNKPNRAQPITDSELDILYESNLLGGSSPESLLNSMWFNNSVHFGLRGVQ